MLPHSHAHVNVHQRVDGSLSGARYDVLFFGWQQAAAAIGGQLNALQMQEAPAAEENQHQPLKAESLTGCGSVMNRQIPTDVLHSQS
jgi:hypothetical protein